MQSLSRSAITLVHKVKDYRPPDDAIGCRAMLVCDSNVMLFHADSCDLIAEAFSCETRVLVEHGEPVAAVIEEMAKAARDIDAELIISVGGGSTIDTAKGICQLIRGRTALPNSFERPGHFNSSAYHLAFPTTGGPGAEVSPAMIFSNHFGKKVAIVDDRLIPKHVVLFPLLATSLPPLETACCLLDGVAHSIEGALRPGCCQAASIACALALRGLLVSALQACNAPGDPSHRERIAMSSVISGEALRFTGVGIVHALASALSEDYLLPHGYIVSATLVAVLEEELNDPGGVRCLDELATTIGFESARTMVSSIQTIWQKYVRGKNKPSLLTRDFDIEVLVRRVMADPRIEFHWTRIDRHRVTRLFHKISGTLNNIVL